MEISSLLRLFVCEHTLTATTRHLGAHHARGILPIKGHTNPAIVAVVVIDCTNMYPAIRDASMTLMVAVVVVECNMYSPRLRIRDMVKDGLPGVITVP